MKGKLWLLTLLLISVLGCAVARNNAIITRKYQTMRDGSPILLLDPVTGVVIGVPEILLSEKIVLPSKFVNEKIAFEIQRQPASDKVSLNRTTDASPGVKARAQDNVTLQYGINAILEMVIEGIGAYIQTHKPVLDLPISTPALAEE